MSEHELLVDCLRRLNAAGIWIGTAKHEIGEPKEFPVSAELVKDGKLTLTFDPLPEEAHLNWHQRSHVS